MIVSHCNFLALKISYHSYSTIGEVAWIFLDRSNFSNFCRCPLFIKETISKNPDRTYCLTYIHMHVLVFLCELTRQEFRVALPWLLTWVSVQTGSNISDLYRPCCAAEIRSLHTESGASTMLLSSNLSNISSYPSWCWLGFAFSTIEVQHHRPQNTSFCCRHQSSIHLDLRYTKH